MVFRNTLAQSSQLFVAQLTSVILAPLLISRLGLAAFGVWAVSGAVATYASLLDFGITRSLARFVALYDARGDRRAVRECMAVGFIAVTALGALAIAAALLTAPLVNDALGHPLPVGQMRTVLTSSAVLLSLNFYGLVCVGFATGLRRMIPPNVAGIFGSLVNFAASVAVLLADPQLTSYAVANAAAGVPALIAEVVAMAYVGGRHLVARPSRARVREVVVFSAKNQVATVSDIVNFQTDKLVIAVAVGVRASAAYEIAARVAIAVRALGMLTLAALVPSATVEVAQRGRGAITAFYVHYTRRVLSVSVPVFALAALTAPYVLTAWIGETPHRAVAVLVGLSIAYMAWTSTGVASTVAVGAGQPGMVAGYAAGAAVLNLLLTAALAPFLGVYGVLLGTVVAMTSMAVAYILRFNRSFAIPPGAFAAAAARPFALVAGLAVPVGLLVAFVLPVPDDRFAALGLLVLVGGGYGLAYWIAATSLDLLPKGLRCPGIRPRPAIAVPPP